MRISDWSSDVCSSDLLGVGLEVGCLAPGGDVDVLDPDSAIEQRADMPRLAIVLPVMGVILANRHLAQDRHAMMHRLAVDDVEIIAEIGRASCRERGCQNV